MTSLSIGAGTPWQARIAYGAALLFTGTSAATNALYGFRKGADLPTSLIWLTVSVAASVVFALGVPALLQSISAKKVAQSLLVCVGLATCGTYSVVAALGSASGGRTDAATAENTLKSAQKRAQATYDKATAELEAVKPPRSVQELEALIAGAKPVCRIVVAHGYRDTICNPPPALTAELARAKRRAELEQKIEAARLELAAPATRQANSDAAVISAYLSALGWTVEADTLNRLLALLAVLVIELGGGASLAIGMALSDRGARAGAEQGAGGSLPGTLSTPPAAATLPSQREIAAIPGVSGLAGTLPSTPGNAARERLLAMLQDGQGTVRGCQAEIGRALGVSRARVRQLLGDLTAAGVIRVRTSATGTVVSRVVN